MSLSNEELRKNLKKLGINPQGDRKGMSKQLKEYLKNPSTETSSAHRSSPDDNGHIPKANTLHHPARESTPENKNAPPPKPVYKVSLPPSPSTTPSRAPEASSSRSTEYAKPVVSDVLPLSEKARGKLPEYMRAEETEPMLPDDFDIWEEIEPRMSSDVSEYEFDGVVSPEEEKVFQERFAKISEMYETNKRAGISYGNTTRIAYAEGIE